MASREAAQDALAGSRYNDCTGIKAAAAGHGIRSRVAAAEVTIRYDTGPGTSAALTCPMTFAALDDGQRIVVTVSHTVQPLLPGFRPVTLTATTKRTITKRSAS